MAKRPPCPPGWRMTNTIWPIGRGFPAYRFKNTETGEIIRCRGLQSLSKNEAIHTLWKKVVGPNYEEEMKELMNDKIR